MLATSGGFVAICPKKEVELGADRLIHRADHAAELRQEIEFPCSKAVTNEYAHLCGGALRAINPNSSMTMAEQDTCAAVFKGNLFNKAELALQLVGCPPQLNEAQLLLHLYTAKGLDMLGMLQGQYAFCLYDSKQARVLAARDHSGAVPLVEGRTAAGSLIIACGTFLPEGVHQMVDIQPGQYKYGWWSLPRAFKCGATKIVSGRASCDYGIRRRSIDAFNASPSSAPHVRGKSLDIPQRPQPSHGHGSSSSSHTPGRYVPPHSAGGFYSRQRAISLDSGGHWGPAPHAVSASLPSPQHAGHSFGGRRRSENNTPGGHQQHPREKSPQQQQQHHAAKPAPSPAAAAVPAAHAPAAAARAAAAALAAAAAATSAPVAVAGSSKAPAAPAAAPLHVAIPAQAPVTPASPGSEEVTGSEASTPLSAGGPDVASPHRRKRRHRSRKHKANSPAGATAAEAGASSDTESQVSTSTHDSANSAPIAPAAAAAAGASPAAGKAKAGSAAPAPTAAAAAGAQGKPQQQAGGKAAPSTGAKPAAHQGEQHSKPHGRGGHQKQPHQQSQQQWQPKAKQAAGSAPAAEKQRRSSSGGGGDSGGSGFKRNGSCGELATLGSSPTSNMPVVLQAAPQGLAC